MRIEILFWDERVPIIWWINFSVPFFEIFFDTMWKGKDRETEIGNRNIKSSIKGE